MMRNINWLCVLILFPTLTWAGGGGIVGNGAGLSEQNVIYAYTVLSQSIDQCLSSPACALRDAEVAQLKKIRDVVFANAGKKDLIRFVSESDQPEFFELSIVEAHRIAKTGLTPDDPIWFNSDLLYNATGGAALDFPLATAILIHEVGHQTGNPDHAFLDGIAAKVRHCLEQKQMIYDYGWDGSALSVQVFNFDSPALRVEVFFTSGNARTPLAPLIVSGLTCEGEGSVLLGYDTWNGHWDNSYLAAGIEVAPFRAWIRYFCMVGGQMVTRHSELLIEFSLQNDGNARLMQVHSQQVR